MDTTQPNTQLSRSGLAIAGLVLGIVAIATSFLPIINNISFFVAIVGLILAAVSIGSIRKGKKRGMGMGVAGLVLCIISLVVVLGSQAFYSAALDGASKELDKMAGNATEEILGTDVDVSVGQFKISKSSYGLVDSSLPVKITNLTDDKASFWIQLEAVDASGARIEESSVIVNDLGPGQSVTEEAFTFISSDKYEAMKNASFGIISISET